MRTQRRTAGSLAKYISRTHIPDVPPLLDSGLNNNFEQAANDSDMRSPVEPLLLDSGSSNYYWITGCSKPAGSVFYRLVFPYLSPDLDAFSESTTATRFRIEQFFDVSNEFSGCTTVLDSRSNNFWTIRHCLLKYWGGREDYEPPGCKDGRMDGFKDGGERVATGATVFEKWKEQPDEMIHRQRKRAFQQC